MELIYYWTESLTNCSMKQKKNWHFYSNLYHSLSICLSVLSFMWINRYNNRHYKLYKLNSLIEVEYFCMRETFTWRLYVSENYTINTRTSSWEQYEDSQNFRKHKYIQHFFVFYATLHFTFCKSLMLTSNLLNGKC